MDRNRIIFPDSKNRAKEDPNYDLRNYILIRDDEVTPILIPPFGGFRERIQAEKQARVKPEPNNDNIPVPGPIGPVVLPIEKEKKSLPISDDNDNDKDASDEERLGAHYRKMKNKVVPPFTAEYLTENRFSPLDAEVRSNALEKYKQSFAAKNFPFEYENPDNEIPEPRVYFDEDGIENYALDRGSGEPNNLKGKEYKEGSCHLLSSRLIAHYII